MGRHVHASLALFELSSEWHSWVFFWRLGRIITMAARNRNCELQNKITIVYWISFRLAQYFKIRWGQDIFILNNQFFRQFCRPLDTVTLAGRTTCTNPPTPQATPLIRITRNQFPCSTTFVSLYTCICVSDDYRKTMFRTCGCYINIV
jgi:hypothetical protein